MDYIMKQIFSVTIEIFFRERLLIEFFFLIILVIKKRENNLCYKYHF